MGIRCFLVWCLLTGGVIPSGQKTKASPALPLTAASRAAWIIGCWHMPSERGEPSVRQTWSQVSADVLVGTSISVPIGLPAEYSFLRIESPRGQGLSLVWQAPGERPVRMPIDPVPASSIDLIAFVNPGVGLPQRVEFRHGKERTLLMMAFFDGPEALQTPMKAVDCR